MSNTSFRSKSTEQHAPRVAVIGAGPGGLAAAARLIDADVDVEIFEASADLGGLARSLTLWDQPVELSAHIFQKI